MNIFNGRANAIFIFGYLAFGLYQFDVITDGVMKWMGFPGIIASIMSFFLSYIPFVGSLLGFFAAVDALGWETWLAGLVFFWFVPAAMLFAILGWTNKSPGKKH